MIKPTIESILEDKENNSVYTIVAYRQLTYEEMITAVRHFYRTAHPRRKTWLKNQRTKIFTVIGIQK
jgi:hypothetical protein